MKEQRGGGEEGGLAYIGQMEKLGHSHEEPERVIHVPVRELKVA